MESKLESRISLKEGRKDPLGASNHGAKAPAGFLGQAGQMPEAKFTDFESYYDGGTVQEGISIADSQAQTGEHYSQEVEMER